MISMNRLHNVKNHFQGPYKRVLCVCSAGLLRSPTAALVLSQDPFNFNTRSVGLSPDYALIPVDDVLLEWADEVVVMNQWMADELKMKTTVPVICLDIPDIYRYREGKLMEIIKESYLAQVEVPGVNDDL